MCSQTISETSVSTGLDAFALGDEEDEAEVILPNHLQFKLYILFNINVTGIGI